jgi:hypothetical protein
MTDAELRAAIKAAGGDLRGLRTTAQLEKRAKALKIPLIQTFTASGTYKKPSSVKEVEVISVGSGGGIIEDLSFVPDQEPDFDVLAKPLTPISVLPDEPLPVNTVNNVLGMVEPVPVVHQQVGGLSQQQVLDVTALHQQRGMKVRFVENCWEFKFKDRMDTGNMVMPLEAVKKCGDLVMRESVSAGRLKLS